MLDLASDWVRWFGDWAESHTFALINAGALLIVGWMVSRWAARRVEKLGTRLSRTKGPYQRLAADFVRYGIQSLILVVALSLVGLPTAGPVALVVALSVVAALATQGMLRNLVAGAMIQAARPVAVGDEIETDGVTGIVTDVGLLSTSLRSSDGVFVSIPNSRLSSRVIRNFSRLGARRLEATVTIGYDQNIDEVLTLCRDLAEANGRVLRNPPPEAVVSALRDTAVEITLRAWTSSAAHTDALYQLNREIKKALDMAGVHVAPTAPRQPLTPVPEPAAYISAAFRSRARSRAIEP